MPVVVNAGLTLGAPPAAATGAQPLIRINAGRCRAATVGAKGRCGASSSTQWSTP